jgi:hypothetical protein
MSVHTVRLSDSPGKGLETDKAEVLCVGANWMHDLPLTGDDYVKAMYKLEGRNQRLWSWLVLCDDSKNKNPDQIIRL